MAFRLWVSGHGRCLLSIFFACLWPGCIRTGHSILLWMSFGPCADLCCYRQRPQKRRFSWIHTPYCRSIPAMESPILKVSRRLWLTVTIRPLEEKIRGPPRLTESIFWNVGSQISLDMDSISFWEPLPPLDVLGKKIFNSFKSNMRKIEILPNDTGKLLFWQRPLPSEHDE